MASGFKHVSKLFSVALCEKPIIKIICSSVLTVLFELCETKGETSGFIKYEFWWPVCNFLCACELLMHIIWTRFVL